MKKFFPAILISFVFTVLMVTQMVLNGQKLSASNIAENKQKFASYESEFSKLTVKTTKGNSVELKAIKKPIVIVNFWASWCRPCISEFKTLNALLKKYDNKIEVIGINNDTEDALKEVKKVEEKHGLKFESTVDEEGDIASKFNITSIPASIVYHKGKVIHFANKEFDFMSEDFVDLIKSKIE